MTAVSKTASEQSPRPLEQGPVDKWEQSEVWSWSPASCLQKTSGLSLDLSSCQSEQELLCMADYSRDKCEDIWQLKFVWNWAMWQDDDPKHQNGWKIKDSRFGVYPVTSSSWRFVITTICSVHFCLYLKTADSPFAPPAGTLRPSWCQPRPVLQSPLTGPCCSRSCQSCLPERRRQRQKVVSSFLFWH